MSVSLTIVGAAAVLIGVAVYLTRRAQQQRSVALQEMAERLGWGFHEQAALSSVPDLKRFELFRQGSHRKLRDLLTSPAGDPRAVVFDFSYRISSGKSSHTVSQTVFYATSDKLRLPSFSLRPEKFLHRVGSFLGYQDIDLERRPEFSRMFLLRGDNEGSVRVAFTDAVVDLLERRPGMCAAGDGGELLFWRPGALAKPEEVRALIENGFELSNRFAGDRQNA
jgi:hypothetical protein